MTPNKALRFSQAQALGSRDNQEDALLCVPEQGLFAVADGLGGHERGEEASAAALAALCRHAPQIAMRAAIRRAHAAVAALGPCRVTGTYQHKMTCECGVKRPGSTVTALHLRDEGAVVGHVGDSRCYHLHAGRLRQVTTDHLGPWGLERALGLARVQPDVVVLPGEGRWLLCTDGLTGALRDEEIARLLLACPIEGAAGVLVAAALARGCEGQDNVTAIVVEVGP